MPNAERLNDVVKTIAGTFTVGARGPFGWVRRWQALASAELFVKAGI